MAAIQTYVFLDLETTGKPREELNKTKITELSMVVVKRCHILETRAGQLPRVQHKLTMCFNPGRTIHPGGTGLDNDLLEFETMFDIQVFNTIKSFLACQEKPLCLIAENGHTFDFPILKNHFEKLKASLDEDVMCADSLHAFYDILKEPGANTGLLRVLPQQTNGAITNGDLSKMLNNKSVNGNNELDCSYKDNYTGINIANEKVIKDDESPLSIQTRNENTPKSKTFKVTTSKKIKEIRRKLFYEKDKNPIPSYKLKDIYERVLRRPGIDAHRAENDCVMTAEIATSKAKEFVDWIDNNHCAFSEVKAMTLGVPLGY